MTLFSSRQLFFLFLVLLPVGTLSIKLLPYQQCEKNFTHNNILQSNINNALLDMVAKSSLHGYAISTYVDDRIDSCETVYGVTQCQGDMSVEACSSCITNAAQEIRSTCPDSAKSRAWYENCFLRYDTENFIGKPDKSYARVWESYYDAANPKEFLQAVGELMGEVMAKTAQGSKKFGYGENYVNEKLTVHGMAQCTRDLDESACNECLQDALEAMTVCKNRDGCRIFGSSCVIRYEVYKFLSFNSEVDATAPAPSNSDAAPSFNSDVDATTPPL